mmetsp:Transcript_38720/g.43204  ORF Transcript_38720/g.43204 Transcript_38720/m.43204 type:complete len:107 (-) Transcript_38720:245-565(-)
MAFLITAAIPAADYAGVIGFIGIGALVVLHIARTVWAIVRSPFAAPITLIDTFADSIVFCSYNNMATAARKKARESDSHNRMFHVAFHVPFHHSFAVLYRAIQQNQ